MLRAALVLLCFGTIAAAQVPINLCPIEGPNVFTKTMQAVTAVNCQPKAADAEFEMAVCWTRSPDSKVPVYLPECICYEKVSELDKTPGLILPGTYAIASSTCPAGFAAVLTAIVIGPRGWGSDSGCDDPGNLCESAQAAFLDEPTHPQALTTLETCHFFSNGHKHCKKR